MLGILKDYTFYNIFLLFVFLSGTSFILKF